MPRSFPAFIVLLLLLVLAPSAGAGIYQGDVVVGPSGALRALGGIDLAPDGTGALVFTLQEGGVDHVFASRLVNGAWGAPERLDAGLDAAPSGQPAVAAADGGRVVTVFTNGGNVYAVTRANSGAGWVRQTLWSGGGASDPHADVSVNGKAYAVFAAPGPGGHDVRVAHASNGGSWTVVGPPLDADAGADAGAGAGRPHVAASADGVGIVVWGEAGRVYARRVQRTRPSVVAADALAGLVLQGVQAAAADSPVVSTQDDDSFTGVALRASFDLGGSVRSRAVFRRLRGSRFETPFAVDAAPFESGQGSVAPRLATVGTGQGLVVAGNDVTNATSALMLLFDIQPDALLPIDTLVANTAPGYAVPAAATARKMVVAWQVTPAGGAPEIHGRYRDGGEFGDETLLSRPELGPTLAQEGLYAGGDDSGNIAVAWLQDVPGQGRAVVVATVDQPPARFRVTALKGFQRSDRPTLAWGTAREQWGRYFSVAIDGVAAGVTGRRSFRPSTPLAQGAHTWQVTALDRRGQQFAAPASTLKVDSVAPFVRARLTGPRAAGGPLRLLVQAIDTPTGTARTVAGVATSGVKEIAVDWGDGSERERIVHGTQHAYARPGRFTLRLLVTDRAGNRTLVRQLLRIARASPRRARRGGRGEAALVLRSAPPRRAPLLPRRAPRRGGAR